MVDHEKFKNIASGIQSFAVSIGLIIAGIWTAHTFGITQDIVSLDLDIQAEQLGLSSDGHPIILIKVIARNSGTQFVELDLSQKAVIIQRVTTAHPDKPLATKTYTPLYLSYLGEHDKGNHSFGSQGVQPKATKTMTFMQQVEGPGIYFVRFMAPISRMLKSRMNDPSFDAEQAAERLGGKNMGPAWVTTTFLVVSETITTPNPALQGTRRDKAAPRP